MNVRDYNMSLSLSSDILLSLFCIKFILSLSIEKVKNAIWAHDF